MSQIPGPQGVRNNLYALRGLVSEPCSAVDTITAEHGPTFQVRLGPLRIVILGDPEHTNDLLNNPNEFFRWGRLTKTLTFIVGKTSILASDGADHKRRRGMVQPGFAKRKLDAWMPLVVSEADRHIDELLAQSNPSEPVAADLYAVSRTVIRRVVTRVLFGADVSDRADDIGELFEPAMEYAALPMARQLPHPFPNTKRANTRNSRKQVDAILDEVIAIRRATPDHDGSNLIDALLRATDGSEPLTDAEIRDQMMTLIAAGYDTTSATLSWAFDHALRTPGVWPRLREEAQQHLDDALTQCRTDALPYATAVIRESLRLRPAGVFAPREVRRDITVGPYAIRKGSLISYSPYVMGRNPQCWDDVLTFNPERFLNNDHDHLMGTAWLPFGRGPRSCIGFALAQMELILTLSRFAQRLDITLVNARSPLPHGVVVSRPQGGIPSHLALA